MFLAQAASLQARATANQGALFSTQAAAIGSMQHSLARQKQLQVQSAILSLRSLGVENASAMQGAVRLAVFDPVKFSRRAAMLHAAAARDVGADFVRANRGATSVPRYRPATRRTAAHDDPPHLR